MSKGPIALIFIEDQVEVLSTIQHHLKIGFKQPIVFGSDFTALPKNLRDVCITVKTRLYDDVAPAEIVNRVNKLAIGQWIYYCFNAEYLFYPFCETRDVQELLTFNTEERRDVMMCYVIDLYAKDLERYPNGVSLTEAHLDTRGYYALSRYDMERHCNKEQQLDVFGGLKRRFEEYIPMNKTRIDRMAIFKATEGLELSDNFTFNNEEYNTYACPWHNSVTAAIMSFRTAKALRFNPASQYDIQSFIWENSASFQWHSKQLMHMGFIEPGQWF